MFSRGGEGILSGDEENKKGPATGRAEASRVVPARTSGFLLGGKSGVLDSSIGSSNTGSRRAAPCLTGVGLLLFVLPVERSAGSLTTALGLGSPSPGNPSRSEKSDNSNDSRKRFLGGELSLRARFSTPGRDLVIPLVTSSRAASDGRLRWFGGSASRVVARGG